MTERGEKKVRATFRRLETDDEFRQRLLAAGIDRWAVMGESGERLDDIGWAKVAMQRRLVLDSV